MLNEEQRCQQCCDQSARQPSYASTISNNYPIYLRLGSSRLTPNTPLNGNTATEPAQPLDSAQSMGSGRERANSIPINKACTQICRPFCTRQCISLGQITSYMNENPSSTMGQGFALTTPQAFGAMTSQESPLLISAQGAARGPHAIIAYEYRPENSQRFQPILPQRSASVASQAPEIVQYAPECASACRPLCNVSCNQRNEGSLQGIESPVYNAPLPTYVPTVGNIESLTQQSAKECLPVCMPQCDKQCIHNRPQPLAIVREPAVTTLQPIPMPTELPLPLPLQPLITECLPSTIETECFCPSGFIVCVSVSGSNQCCRRR
uniref:Uncharacterized protein n=1 Tax=Parascaris equorum TaxID=6256 RepID=A0A914S5Y7_PAREQ